MSNKNLSFFVPTYNRKDSLRETLNSVFKYWDNQSLNEIIVSDNNLDDLAKNVLAEFNSKHIIYSPNLTNVGIDRNMIKFLDLCKSKYCWLLGDDDCLNDKSYKVLESFLEEDVDFIILLDGNKVENYEEGIHNINDIDSIGRVFLSFWDKIPFGNVIVNVDRAKCLEVNDYSKYIDTTNHVYSGVLWELVLSQYSTGKFGVVTTKVIEALEVEKTWKDMSVRIYFQDIPIWFKLLPKKIDQYTEIAYDKYLENIFGMYSLLQLVSAVNKNKKNKVFFCKNKSNFPLKYRFKWFYVSLLFPFYQLYKKKY